MNLSIPFSARSEALKEHIREEIQRASGHIHFAHFMELALYTPQLGYYCGDDILFGARGDFITAPTLSPLFTHSVVNQFELILQHLPKANILEVGAGSGVFAKDALLELERRQQLPRTYFILDISPSLRKAQHRLLEEHCPHLLSHVKWVATCPPDFRGIIFANEVLDALPARCFRIEDDHWMERTVTWEKDQFCWHLTPASSIFQAHVDALTFPSHYESEMNFAISPWIQSLATHLQQGVMLLLDYGYGRREYYHPDRAQGTLMCFYQHHAHSNPFLAVGLQDISIHVDFTTVIESAIATGLQLGGYTTQAGFLLASGILDLVTDYSQHHAIKTLTLPSQMGELVKVMALTKNFNLPLQGFSLHDRRRDL